MRHGGDGWGCAQRVEESGEPGRIDLAVRQDLAAVDAGGDEEPVDPKTLRGGEIGAYGIANGEDARQARRAPAQLGGACECRRVSGGMRLAGPEHLPAQPLV